MGGQCLELLPGISMFKTAGFLIFLAGFLSAAPAPQTQNEVDTRIVAVSEADEELLSTAVSSADPDLLRVALTFADPDLLRVALTRAIAPLLRVLREICLLLLWKMLIQTSLRLP